LKKEKQMKKKKFGLLIIVMVIGLVMSACAAKASSEESVSQSAPMEPAADMAFEESLESEMMAEERGFDAGVSNTSAAAERMVIYNANLQIAVQDPLDAMEQVIQMAEDAGGFVVYSNTYKTNTDRGRFTNANLTVRVPAGQLDSIMSAIKRLTPVPSEDVLSENVSGQDVTAEYTDLTSRLRNLEAAEEKLTEIMEQAQDTEDVLDVFDELTYYRGEIEVVKGRMKYLEESSDLSAISIEIIAKESIQPVQVGGWEPKGTAKAALEALINTGQFIVDAAIWLGIYCLPFLIPLGIAVYFLVRLIRKNRAKRKAKKAEVMAQTKSTE
jgi:flagellar basal body-associated protein FliL